MGIRQSRYFGRAKTRFQLYLAATAANLTLVAAKAGLTGKTGSGPNDSSGPGHWNGQLRHRMARANLDPLPARIGLTDQIPLPNKGFPSGFLGQNYQDRNTHLLPTIADQRINLRKATHLQDQLQGIVEHTQERGSTFLAITGCLAAITLLHRKQ